MTSGHVCGKCGAPMSFDFDGSPRCGRCNGLWARFKSLFSPKPRLDVADKRSIEEVLAGPPKKID
jgi:hypothetical protein